MSEIDLTARSTPAIVLFNAICKKFARDTLREGINMPEGSVGDVKLTFNGVEIPFEETIEDLWRQVNEDVDGRAIRKAEDIIKGAGLEKVREAIYRAEREIDNALEESLKQIKEKE